MRSTLAVTVACGALLASLSACGSAPGTPTTTPTTGGTGAVTTTTASPTTAATSTTAADREINYQRDELCELLTAAETAEFGSRNPRPGNSFTTGSEQCQWSGDLGITIDFKLDASGVRPAEGTKSDIEVAETPAVLTKTTEKSGLCLVRIKLNKDRSAMTFGVGVLSSGRDKGYETCDVAKKVAEIVIPKVKG
ncbi:DUF3558 family protein [Actinokineospora fastidiosa]|uniref:DUF3558 domain-containing protein n=1 Tax=Actinokineospora fastidiosa TaxID=1816 RepID=A0A918G3B7_9PSEU|nr:DUF3558 family protein [Actinokineospora fastidiosa]GGS16822.1 hypothetical protein GCM10010171_06350 [Actinokineospora fastidiosa]